MSYGEEYPRQLAARFRNAARDLLDQVAHADREQKRQLVQQAFKLVQTAEALQPFAVEDERASARRARAAVAIPREESPMSGSRCQPVTLVSPDA